MDVTELLDPLVRCTNVEVMVPSLPDALQGAPGLAGFETRASMTHHIGKLAGSTLAWQWTAGAPPARSPADERARASPRMPVTVNYEWIGGVSRRAQYFGFTDCAR